MRVHERLGNMCVRYHLSCLGILNPEEVLNYRDQLLSMDSLTSGEAPVESCSMTVRIRSTNHSSFGGSCQLDLQLLPARLSVGSESVKTPPTGVNPLFFHPFGSTRAESEQSAKPLRPVSAQPGPVGCEGGGLEASTFTWAI